MHTTKFGSALSRLLDQAHLSHNRKGNSRIPFTNLARIETYVNAVNIDSENDECSTDLSPPLIAASKGYVTHAVQYRYYPNYRASPSTPPSSLCLDAISHIFYAFAAVRADGTVYLSNPDVDIDLEIDGVRGALRACAKLKLERPDLKLVLSIGGAEGSKENFASTASNASCRSEFGYTARMLVDQYDFDGVDVDWEHPDAGQQSADYIQLLRELRTYLPSPRYIVTTALPAAEWCLNRFDLEQLSPNIDLLNLMGYDYVGNWGSPIMSGHHAALHAPNGGESSSSAIAYLTSRGFPTSKILLGCPVYGWSFLDCDNINQATERCGNDPAGCYDYAELPRQGASENIDTECVAAYCVGGDGGFVSYDNVDTIRIKAEYVKTNRLAGMFYWHVLADAQDSRSLVHNGYVSLHS